MSIAEKLRRIAPYSVVLGISAYLHYLAVHLDYQRVPDRIGPDAWPRMILVLLVAICALQVIRIAVGRPSGETGGATQDPLQIADMDLPDEPDESQRRVWIGIGCTFGYVFAFQWIGFLAASFVYLLALMVVGGYRRLVPAVVIALAGSLSFVFVFMKIVYVSLPLGRGPFLSFSSAVMRLLGIH